MSEISTDRHQIFYRSHGVNASDSDTVPLILVHGAGGTLMNWPPAVRRLPEQPVYALDLPGHGKSPGPGLTSISAYRDALLEFVDALELPRFVLAGHSMGAAIAIETALCHPERVSGLVLLGANAQLKVEPSILTGLQDDYDKTCAWLVKLLFGSEADRRLRIGYLRYLSLLDRDLLRGDFIACDAFDRTDQVHSIRTPTMIICGADDKMTPPAASRFLHDQVADSGLEVIENAGHMVMLEQPDRVALNITNLLSSL